jgi:hypothetical protein
LAIVSALALVFIGQVSIGNSFFSLLPNKLAGFPVYVQPNMISAANWAREHLGTDQVFATDATNMLSITTTGQENPVNVNVIYPLFFTAGLDGLAENMIKTDDVHYVLLDWLATEETPVQPEGPYYSALEPDTSLNGKPIPKAYYAKFYEYTCSHLVYSSGSIQIYDVSQIADSSCAPKLIQKTSGKASSGKKSATKKAAS